MTDTAPSPPRQPRLPGALDPDAGPRVPAVEQAVRIVEHLVRLGEPVGVSDLARAVGLPKSTCFAILRTLERASYVVHMSDLRWTLGLRLAWLNAGMHPRDGLREQAEPVLRDIVKRCSWPAHLAVYDQGEVLYVSKVESPRFIRFATYPGLRARIHLTALGKALAAHLPDPELRSALIRFPVEGGTKHAIRSADDLQADLALVRQRGYAVEWEEGEFGVCCVAAPILIRSREPLAAIGITALVAEMSPTALRAAGRLLTDEAAALTHTLGVAE